MSLHGIGAAAPRLEDIRFITGRGRYTDDISFPGQVYLAIVRSPHAAARITGIDASAALDLPGVLKVLTGKDALEQGFGTFTSKMRKNDRAGNLNFEPPYRILQPDEVRFVGDTVAAVIATSQELAVDAAELIHVEYEELPAVGSIRAALAADARQLWDEVPGNESFYAQLGNCEETGRAFASADHVVRMELPVSRVTHGFLEPRAGIATYDPNEDRYTLYAPVQGPHVTRHEITTRILKGAGNQLRVISPDVGGGFGGKGYSHPELPLLLWAAREAGRPVKWVGTRSEGFMGDHHARDNLATIELALSKDGEILGLRGHNILNMGAYLSNAGLQCGFNNVGNLSGVYRNRNIAWEVSGVFTNTTPIIAMRGAGRPEHTYYLERMIDIAADDLGMDPAELRRRNLIQASDLPYDTGFVFTYDSGDFVTVMDKTLAAADWDGFPARREEAAARGKLRGIGMAFPIEVAAGVRDETADVRFDTGGGLTIVVGTRSCGQGHETSFRQIVTSKLGIPGKDIRMLEGDTDLVPFGRGTGASRSISVAGCALAEACDRVIARGRKIAAFMLDATEEQVTFEGGWFEVAGTNRKTDIVSVAKFSHEWRQLPKELGVGLAERASFLLDAPNFPNGCHICEVEIDPDTGETQVVGYWLTEDVGTVINPHIVDGQAMGGIAQGLGQALSEQILYDEASAQLMTGSFMDYCMPRARDIPRIEVENHEVPTPTNPLGVKGAGESSIVGALPAVMNAVCNALKPLGIRHIDMPATPSRVWEAIRAARETAPDRAEA